MAELPGIVCYCPVEPSYPLLGLLKEMDRKKGRLVCEEVCSEIQWVSISSRGSNVSRCSLLYLKEVFVLFASQDFEVGDCYELV